MNYELAKQLKDAGFPQFVGEFEGSIIEDINAPEGEEPISCYHPTLSELIESCGDEFESLERKWHRMEQKSTWIAFGIEQEPWSSRSNAHGEGNTPEEAVANLYLALNKKQ